MSLNTVLIFGELLDWSSSLTLALMIIGLLLLVCFLIWLIVWLIRISRRDAVVTPKKESVKAETTRTTTRVERIIVQDPAAPRVVVVQQPASEPQVVVMHQQAAPQPQQAAPRQTAPQPQPQPQPQPRPAAPASQPVQQPQPSYAMQSYSGYPMVPFTGPNVILPLPADEEDDFEDEDEFLEESVDGGVIRYNRSFMAKYIQSSDETKDYYVHLKNKLLSYLKVRARVSWKRESFSFGRAAMARLVFRGKTLCLCLPLDPAQFTDGKYQVEDVSDIALYADTPCLYRIRSERRLAYAYELIDIVAQNIGTAETNRHYEDYYLPYEGIVQLIDKGLVKRVIRYNDSKYIRSDKT